MTRLSTREVGRAYTFDPNDCTASGVLVQCYTDGHVAVTKCTRWQGSRDGERWVTEAGWLDPKESYGVTPDHREDVLEANLKSLGVTFEDDLYHLDSRFNGQGPSPAGFRQVCSGWVVA